MKKILSDLIIVLFNEPIYNEGIKTRYNIFVNNLYSEKNDKILEACDFLIRSCKIQKNTLMNVIGSKINLGEKMSTDFFDLGVYDSPVDLSDFDLLSGKFENLNLKNVVRETDEWLTSIFPEHDIMPIRKLSNDPFEAEFEDIIGKSIKMNTERNVVFENYNVKNRPNRIYSAATILNCNTTSMFTDDITLYSTCKRNDQGHLVYDDDVGWKPIDIPKHLWKIRLKTIGYKAKTSLVVKDLMTNVTVINKAMFSDLKRRRFLLETVRPKYPLSTIEGKSIIVHHHRKFQLRFIREFDMLQDTLLQETSAAILLQAYNNDVRNSGYVERMIEKYPEFKCLSLDYEYPINLKYFSFAIENNKKWLISRKFKYEGLLPSITYITQISGFHQINQIKKDKIARDPDGPKDWFLFKDR